MRLHRVTRAGIAAACALALCPLLAPPAATLGAGPAGEIAAVCDEDVAPYRALVRSFAQACGCTVRVIPPAEAARGGLEQRLQAAGVRAVLAVGLEARAAVEGVRGLPVLLTMAPQAESWVAGQPNRLGIEMALSPSRHLETMQLVFPRARRVGVLYDPAQNGAYVREAQRAAANLGLALVPREVERPAALAPALAGLRGQVDVIWLLPDATVLRGENLNLLLLASFESRTPLYGFARKHAELGAVAATHLAPAALGAQAAALLGEPPGAAPARRHVYARDAQLILNQKIARKMGLSFGPGALEVADDVLR